MWSTGTAFRILRLFLMNELDSVHIDYPEIILNLQKGSQNLSLRQACRRLVKLYSSYVGKNNLNNYSNSIFLAN